MQRISEWIPLRSDKQGANITVIPWQQRPDLDKFANDTVIYSLKDLFTVKDGNWDAIGARFGPPQWARDTYLKPMGDPNGCPAGGAATHIILSCVDQNGGWMPGKGMLFTTDRAKAVANGIKDTAIWSMRPLAADHWYVIEMLKTSVYMPDGSRVTDGYDVQGPWVLMPVGLGDIIVGVGLPYSWHVSTFAIWQELPRSTAPTPDPDPTPDPVDNGYLERIAVAEERQADAEEREADAIEKFVNYIMGPQ